MPLQQRSADGGCGGGTWHPEAPLRPPSGCVFHTRCPIAIDECRTRRPDWRNVGTADKEHWVWCHRV